MRLVPFPADACPLSEAPAERLAQVRRLAEGLLAAHGLHDWSFAYNRRKRSLGLCLYGRRRIELSAHLVRHNSRDEIVDTLLHEIAHALVGPGHGHGRRWREKCREIGARPERCGQAVMPPGRWRARCGWCGKDFHRYRRPKRLRGWYCPDCGLVRGRLTWRGR
jgi:predicted SprT family Zn-dependent metalloprotease